MPKFKVTRNVTLPTLSLKEGQIVFVRFEEPIYVGKKVEPKAGDTSKQKEPPHLVNVVDLETGELKTLILNTVLKSTIDEAYPNGAYVRKSFRVEKLPKKAGKEYHGFVIQEVEAQAEADAGTPGAEGKAGDKAFDQPHHGHEPETIAAVKEPIAAAPAAQARRK